MQVCLAEHPDIYMPHGEIPFFESPFYESSTIADLENLFDGRAEKCLGIKRPSYIGIQEVPARIQKHLPDAKLIAVLRNPIDRAISAYFHNVRYGFIPAVNIEIGMKKIMFEPSFSLKNKRAPEIIEFGYYYKYLSKYKHYIDNKNILFFLHEDISTHPLTCIQEAYKFLDVSPEFVPESLESRPQKVVYNITRLKLLRLQNRFVYRYSKDRTRLFPKKISSFGRWIDRKITRLDQKVLSKWMPNMRPSSGSDLRKILYDVYAEDIKSLENLIYRDLSAWR